MKRYTVLIILFLIILIESIALARAGDIIKTKDKYLSEYALTIDIRNTLLQKITGTNDLVKQLEFAQLPKTPPKPGVIYTSTLQKGQYSTPGAYFLGNDGTICYQISGYNFCRDYN